MSEPPRLLDDSESATEKALLHAGRSFRSGREARAKTLAARGIASATAVVAAAGSAAAASAFAKLTGAKLLVAVSAVGAGFLLRLDASATVPLVKRRFVTTTPEQTVGTSPGVAPIFSLVMAHGL